MTGLNIVKKLNLDNNNIFIVNDLFEVCSENNFKYFPLSSLLINSKIEKKDLYQKFINSYLSELKDESEGMKIFNHKQSLLKYPETFPDAINRYKNIADVLYNEICNNSNNSLNIIVTHGYGVQVITETLFGKTKNEKELLKKEDFFVDYCTSYCFNFLDEKEIKFIGRIDPSFD